MSDEINHISIILEDIRDQNKAVLEAVGVMQEQMTALPRLVTDVAELKQDMKIVKAAITDVSKEQRDFDRRLTQLQSA